MEDQSLISDIYLFIIDSDAEGYAHYGAVYKRKEGTSTKLAAKEIIGGSAQTNWTDATEQHAGAGLDMKFSSARDSLVFVFIRANRSSGQAADAQHDDVTYFGREVVADLQIAPRMQLARIIKNPLVYPEGNAQPWLCSFEMDVRKIRSELSSASSAAHVRFPVVFDFVDSDDGVSPVFKKPKSVNAADILDHGGIHPRGGSSMIIFEDQ